MPKLPSLDDFTRGKGDGVSQPIPSLPRPTPRRTVFQRRPSVQRRRGGGTQQPSYGSPLELRAAQDAIGTVEFRIVLQELRRRGLIFSYQDSRTGIGVPVLGFTVDFLVTSLQPYVAIDIIPGAEALLRSIPLRDAFKAAALESASVRYGVLYGADIRLSAAWLEGKLDELLGESIDLLGNALTTTPVDAGYAVGGYGDAPPPLPGEAGPVFPTGGGGDGGQEVIPVATLAALETRIAALERLMANHSNRHEAGGPDSVPVVAGSGNWPYDLLISPLATQRVGFLDDFSGLTGAATTDRYRLVGSAEFANDGTHGRTYLTTFTETVAGNSSFGVRNGDGAAPSTGMKGRAAENPSMKFLLREWTAPVGGTQDYLLGLVEGDPAGASLLDGIYFRATVPSGNWFLVCRDAGVESTVDMGIAPTTSYILLEFRVSDNGTIVSGYYNNTLIGSITTNIPTNILTGPYVAHHNRAATVTTAGRIACFVLGVMSDARE